jgi:hypothetical protein
MKKYSSFLLFVILLIMASSCKKDPFIDDNFPPDYHNVSTAKIKNYINRIYIDLLGREPLKVEMERDLNMLQTDSLSIDSRLLLIQTLQTDTTFREGDTSYQYAYYNRLYETLKARLIEGVEDDYIYEQLGLSQTALSSAQSAGDSFQIALISDDIEEFLRVLSLKNELRLKNIDFAIAHKILLDNYIYETINMNTFNFVNSTFDNLLFRFPTAQEATAGYNMIEYNMSGNILGMNGNSREDYLNILTQSPAFREGLIIWTFRSLLQRDPTDAEVSTFMNEYGANIDYESLQKTIMSGDEYAQFN